MEDYWRYVRWRKVRTEAVEGFILAKACCRVSTGSVLKAEPRFQDLHMAVISMIGDCQVRKSTEGL